MANDLQTNNPPLMSAGTIALIEAAQLPTVTPTTAVASIIDSLLVDDYGAAEWEVVAMKSDGTRLTRKITAVHNGTASADATTVASAGGGIGISSELTDISVDLSGVATAQVFNLKMTFTFGAGTWKITAWRLPMKPPQYS